MKFKLIQFGLTLLLLAVTEAKHKNYGGKIARDGQFPFAVSLFFKNKHFCGASIIHERWVLTAAHCIGTQDYYKNNAAVNTGSGTYKVKKIFRHPGYVYVSKEKNNGLEYSNNDIGLIRLTSNITFDDRAQPITLATEEDGSFDNDLATLPGWGYTSYHDNSTKNLRYVNVRVLTREECRSVWTYADKHICTSTREHQGMCYGDSGSPLVVGNVQIGVASMIDGEYCNSLKPDLHTKVSSFIPWIKRVMSRYGDNLPDSEDD